MTVRRLAVALLCLLFTAQTPQDKSTLSSTIDTRLPDQMTGAITPAILRNTLKDMLASWQQYASVNAQTGTSYTISATDYGKLVTLNNGSPVSVSIPQINPFSVFVANRGVGAVTITPTSGNIGGAANLTLQNSFSVMLVSDGTNYQVFKGNQGGGGGGGPGTPGGSYGAVQSNDGGGGFYGDNGFLYTGGGSISVSSVNPVGVFDNANDRYSFGVNCKTNSSTSNVNFSNEACVQLDVTGLYGHATYGGGTTAKTTFAPLAITAIYNAAGQRFTDIRAINCYGEGDCFHNSVQVSYAGGDISGDEGQGFWSASRLGQQNFLVKTTISTVTRTLCNTTLTQTVTASKDPQTVTVSSSTNCNVGDWVVLGQAVHTMNVNITATKLTGVAAGQLTGIFAANYVNGTTVTPALVLTVPSSFQSGQLRTVVNLSGASYTTGSISTITTGNLVGSGTTWANNMVGGSATNIGCIALDVDDYTNSPFDASTNRLKAWFPIIAVNSATNLTTYSSSVAGQGTYGGKGPPPGGYQIRPCARVLYLGNSNGGVTGEMVLESTSTVWSVGNTIETTISPYPDVTGFFLHFAGYTPGTYRAAMDFRNTGGRKFATGLQMSSVMGPTSGGADAKAWGVGVSIADAESGISIIRNSKAGILMNSPLNSGDCPSDNCNLIDFLGLGATPLSVGGAPAVGGGLYLRTNTINSGMDFGMCTGCNGGTLQGIASQVVAVGFNMSLLKWFGGFQTTPTQVALLPPCTAALEGTQRAVTNSNTITFAATVAGGGSNHVNAYCDGTNWTVH